jgi:hypothetical protein
MRELVRAVLPTLGWRDLLAGVALCAIVAAAFAAAWLVGSL